MTRLFVVLALSSVSLFVLWRARTLPTMESFLVANRNISFKLGVATLTANWVQAPAILASGVLAYQSPYHFLAFIVPNVLALVIMGILAPKIQKAMPGGYTVPEYMGHVFGPGVRTLFFISSLGALSLAVAYTFTGLRQWFTQQLGMDAVEVAVILGVFACLWVFPRGLPNAILGDAVKVSLIGLGVFGALSLVGSYQMPISAIAAVSPGLSPMLVFWTLGVPLTASLLGGPICNPDLGERMYAVDSKVVRQAYFYAAGLFGIAVLVFGSLGFCARYLNIKLAAGQLPAFAMIQASVPEVVTVAVTVGLVVVFATALASILASTGDLIGIELYRRFIRPNGGEAEMIMWSRGFMLVPIVIGTYLASLEKVDLTMLLQSMAIVRGEAIIPIILAVFWPYAALSRYVFWGMGIAALGGVLLTFGQTPFLVANGKPLGAIFAVAVPLIAWCVGLALHEKRSMTAAKH